MSTTGPLEHTLGILHIYRVRGVAELSVMPQGSNYNKITASYVTSLLQTQDSRRT